MSVRHNPAGHWTLRDEAAQRPVTSTLGTLRNILSKFSVWKPWSERSSLPINLPGVYLLAEFKGQAPSGKPALTSNLIYIGETCSQTLHGRLYQFNRSGFFGKLGHSGGATFARTYGAQSDPSWLFISVMAVDLEEPRASAFIRYAERALLWGYVQNHGAYPACNRK